MNRRRMLIALAIALLAGLILAPMARAGTDDYPAQWRNAAQDSAIDSWGYYNRECTSFVAWRLHARNGFEMPRAIGNAGTWGSWFSAHGYAVNGTPGVGAIAESSGHVAWVEAVNGDGTVTIEEYNYSYNGMYNERRVAASLFHYIHAHDITTGPPAPSPPGVPGAVSALPHGSRVNLRWDAAAGAADYLVYRDGVYLTAVNASTYLDIQVSPRQDHTYTITARNAAGTSSPVSKRVETAYEAADRADLPTKDGPALCGRAGGQTSQSLVCNVHKSTGWVTSTSAPNDWGYSSDRSWLRNLDGTVSYCRRVGNGAQVLCDRFDGTGWTSSMSPPADLGYGENRAYLPTKDGPAVCGRAGDQSAQSLVCNVQTSAGWTSVTSPAGDWGYATDRSWLTNADGTVSYCRRVGNGDQARCDRFDGLTWTSSVSPHTDLAYNDNRTYLSTKDGPAICGRAGDQSAQSLVCTVLKPTGWVTATSIPNDWGYAIDRSWITNRDGTVSYCRRVGTGAQVLCDRFDGTAWTSSMSPSLDFGYPENRAYLATKDGPGVCGRAGDQSSQALVCNVQTPLGWVSAAAQPNDWGYSTDRSWLANADGTVSYCRRVGSGAQALCDRFDGTAWTSTMSPSFDYGYPDTF